MADGQKQYHAYVASFTDPATGQARFAACYDEPTGAEYIDYPTLAEAEADYEQNVRNLQSCTQGQYDEDGEPQVWFETTDVEPEAAAE